MVGKWKGREVSVAITGNVRTPCSDGYVLHLDCFSGNILVANLTIILQDITTERNAILKVFLCYI